MEMTSRLRLLVRFSGDEMRHYGAKEIHLENEWAILEQYNAKQFGPDVLLWRHFSSIVTLVQCQALIALTHHPPKLCVMTTLRYDVSKKHATYQLKG